MISFLTIVILLGYVFCCFILIAVILLQSGKGGGLSSLAGGGSGIQEALGATSAEKTLNRGTTMAAVGFMVMAILLSIMGTLQVGKDRQIFDTPAAESTTFPIGSQPGTSAPLGNESMGGEGQPITTDEGFVLPEGFTEQTEPMDFGTPEEGSGTGEVPGEAPTAPEAPATE